MEEKKISHWNGLIFGPTLKTNHNPICMSFFNNELRVFKNLYRPKFLLSIMYYVFVLRYFFYQFLKDFKIIFNLQFIC